MAVDFVMNCYERTYRQVLSTGFIADEMSKHGSFSFDQVTVMINNVDEPGDAVDLAKSCGADRYLIVSDCLGDAVSRTKYPARGLRSLKHYSDCILTAVCAPGPDWMVYWDAEATLRDPVDWISPSIEFMRADPRIVVSNPESWLQLAEREAQARIESFAVGYGFSDHAVLARRSELARPIYRSWAPASWRYPLAPWEAVFEQRLDAFMRRHGRLRATYLPATYEHFGAVGQGYPEPTIRSRALGKAQRRLGGIASSISSHPAMHAWP